MNNLYAGTNLTINLESVRQNYSLIKAKVGKTKVSAVVKANAYGLGVVEISKALYQEGSRTFFVANLDEAIELRKTLSDIIILVLNGISAGEEEVFTRHELVPVINSKYQIQIWNQHATKIQKKLSCILHFDTGMNRLGIRNYDSQNLSSYLTGLQPLYIMSHLACADDNLHPMNQKQLDDFQIIAHTYKNIPLSISNSGGVFLDSKYHLDMVRPGIAIYGVNPSISLKNPMKNVISLTSKILQIERIDSPGTVGYGAAYKAKIGTKIATIALGYADGYLRSLSNVGICAVEGIIVPVIGRVSMDIITIDVTKIPDEKLSYDTKIEIIGDNIPIDLVAQKAGTIGYEILTSLGSRYKRIYI